MAIPKRLKEQEGQKAQVDGIPFTLPVSSHRSPALMAVFPINPDKARALLPGRELHPFILWKNALLVITVIDYRETVIGKYIEFSIAIACTHGPKPAPPLLPAAMPKHYGIGQFVYDLPVSTEISVKGGKGIWGMPKHQASLNFMISNKTVSSQYNMNKQLAMKIEIDRPSWGGFPIQMGGANYCQFRGMLMKSYVYFKGTPSFALGKKASARLIFGDHPRIKPLRDLEIGAPIFTAFFPETSGLLDDHFECWFLYDREAPSPTEGLESVVGLGLSEVWPEPPDAQ